jgi:small basic protein
MEEPQDQSFKNETPPSYWTSVTVSSLIFGIVAFIISIISGYAIINSEPTGSMFSPVQLVGVLACLIGAFGGMLATWHYAREYDVPIKLGRGALIGFLTGVGITIVSVLLGQIWQVIDPDMTQKMIDSTIANMEAMDMPEEQKQQLIDSTVESVRSQQSISTQFLWGIPIYGILNLLTGMIGAKIFGKKEKF